MKRKIWIAILWPCTIILALWIGAIIGTGLGTKFGKMEARNMFTWGLCADLADIGKSVNDPKITETLNNVHDLIQAVGQPEYSTELYEFERKIKQLLNQAPENSR